MKLKLMVLMLLLYTSSYSQDNLETSNSIFIFTRSTELKSEYIAKDFNLIDSLSTHVGIGIMKNDAYIIYNVSNDRTNNNSALICENLESFTNVDGIKYYSVWKASVSNKEINKISKIFDEYSKLKIDFDYDFNIHNNNKLYCSEFVYNVLQKINTHKFYYKPMKKKLNQFYQRALNKTNLEYIPVDFFTQMNVFTKVDENYSKNEN